MRILMVSQSYFPFQAAGGSAHQDPRDRQAAG